MKPTTNISAPSLANISKRALLVDLSTSCLGTSRTDQKITKDTNDRHGIQDGFGKFTKSIIDPKALDPIKKIMRAAYVDHRELTLPWTNDGSRIIAAGGLEVYREKIKVHERAYWDAVTRDIKPNFPKLVAEAKKALNGGFDITQYPDYKLLDLTDLNRPRWHNASATKQFDKKFAFDLQISPVPTADDFRVDMEAEELDALKQSYEEFANDRIKGALDSVWDRLHDSVEHMLNRLKTYGQPIFDPITGKESGKTSFFLDTLVSNVDELLDLVPLLNITGDPNITRIAAQMRNSLTQHSPQMLRQNEIARNDVASRAEEILSKMQAFLQ